MKNLLLSLLLAAALYVVSSLLAGSWLAGLAPALIGASILYFVLARRSFKAFEAVAQQAMATLQGAQGDPSKVDAAKEVLRGALRLGDEQFLIKEQVHGQLGQLSYMQGRNEEARGHLQKAWSRDWLSMTTLAALEHREGQTAAAVERLAKVASTARSQALYWGVRAWVLNESGDSRAALAVLAEGLEANKDSASLKAWREALANKGGLDLMAFGPMWFQIFPDHVQRLRPDQQLQLMQAAGQAPPPGAGPQGQPVNRAARRAAARGKASTEPVPGPSFPHPRR